MLKAAPCKKELMCVGVFTPEETQTQLKSVRQKGGPVSILVNDLFNKRDLACEQTPILLKYVEKKLNQTEGTSV